MSVTLNNAIVLTNNLLSVFRIYVTLPPAILLFQILLSVTLQNVVCLSVSAPPNLPPGRELMIEINEDITKEKRERGEASEVAEVDATYN